MSNVTPVLLLILDGFGHRLEGEDNAILHAQTPNWDRLRREYPYTTLDASEHAVGLPSGQFGNSEVGHLNIGAGRVVQQDISRVDLDIETGQFANNAVITEAIATAKRQGVLHIMGLLSDGGVHSHEAHIHALIQAAHTAGVPAIYVHAFLDGRDTPPRSAHTYLDRLNTVLAGCPQARLVSMVGRYWAMDRDKRWERVLPAYQLLVEGEAAYHAADANSALDAAYARDENDEFVQATVIGEPVKMQDGDVVLFMNFRADRARQLTTALTDPAFDAFAARRVAFSYFASLTSYGEAYQHPVAYPPQKIRQTLGEYLSGLGLRQLRIAETEKYPHVTYFFNGGEEAVYEGEDRILVPSPKVATYDLQPEMNAPEVTAHIEQAVASGQYHAIICNYANGDMVGHTGVMPAAIKAVETLDQCVARCVSAMLAAGGEVLITADHGNCEQMHDHAHNQAHTQHTLNRVPCLYIGQRAAHFVGEGALRDIAPTLLAMMGLSQPAEMTGRSLLHFD